MAYTLSAENLVARERLPFNFSAMVSEKNTDLLSVYIVAVFLSHVELPKGEERCVTRLKTAARESKLPETNNFCGQNFLE